MKRWITCTDWAIAASASSRGRSSARSAAIGSLARRSRAKEEKADRHCTVVQGDFSIESGVAAAERLLGRAEPPTAIFCFNDEMAMGVIEMARQRSVHVPRDLSVVGFDDIRFARHTYPPLTTIAQPVRQIGEGTVRLLLGILSGGDEMDTPASVTLRHTLVVRASTGPPRRRQ